MRTQALDLNARISRATVAAIAVSRVRDLARPDLIFLTGLGVLLIAGVITPSEAFAGFASPAVAAVRALLIAAAGIEETGVVRTFDRIFLHNEHSSPR